MRSQVRALYRPLLTLAAQQFTTQPFYGKSLWKNCGKSGRQKGRLTPQPRLQPSFPLRPSTAPIRPTFFWAGGHLVRSPPWRPHEADVHLDRRQSFLRFPRIRLDSSNRSLPPRTSSLTPIGRPVVRLESVAAHERRWMDDRRNGRVFDGRGRLTDISRAFRSSPRPDQVDRRQATGRPAGSTSNSPKGQPPPTSRSSATGPSSTSCWAVALRSSGSPRTTTRRCGADSTAGRE